MASYTIHTFKFNNNSKDKNFLIWYRPTRNSNTNRNSYFTISYYFNGKQISLTRTHGKYNIHIYTKYIDIHTLSC